MNPCPGQSASRAIHAISVLLSFAVPATAQAAWQRVPGASARYSPALVHDPVRNVTVLYGGSGGAPLHDTWEWNGSNWHQVPVSSPQLDVVFGGVFDPQRQQVVVFGTAQPMTPLQVWGFDGAQWTQHLSPDAVNPVDLASTIYDSGRSRIVVVANLPTVGNGVRRLWAWDGVTWLQSNFPHSNVAPLAYDAARGTYVILQGSYTVTYDGSTWSLLFTHPGRYANDYVMLWDPRRQKVVHMGGRQFTSTDTVIMVWNGTSWSIDPIALPGPRERMGACFDATANGLMIVGGRRLTTGVNEITPGTLTESAAGFVLRDAGQYPVPGERPALCHDPVRDRLVLFGGRTVPLSNRHFEWDPASGWSERALATPPARCRSRLVHDPARGRLLLFGGLATAPLGDTWTFDGNAWLQRTPASTPGPRYEPAMTYDEDRQVVVLYGGRDAANNFRDTWEWNGADWQLRVASYPPAEARAVLAFDPRRHRCVLVTSGSPGPVIMWLWDGANWTSTAVPAVRPDLTASDLLYDRARARLVLFGDGAGGSEAWDEELGSWSLRGTEPRIAREAAFAWDGARDRTVSGGGKTPAGLATADVWQFASPLPASMVAFGQGCPGPLGMPALTASGRPWLGDTVTLAVDAVPPAALAMINSGFSNTSHLGTPLPFDLAPLGYPGCAVLAAPAFPTLATGSPLPVRSMALAIPAVAAFAGIELFHQALALEPATLRIFASGGLQARVGIR